MTFFQPQQVLMCAPSYYAVSYDINPWMTGNQNKTNLARAQQQWISFRETLEKYTQVLEIDPQPGLPDLVFTANAGFVWKNTVIVSRFCHGERQAETPVFRKWFADQNYEIKELTWYFEGQGDLLSDSAQRFWLGTGFRTVPEAATELELFLESHVHVLELVDPRWYHLDTAFCPLPGGELLWYPGAFSPASRSLVNNHFDRQIRISETDALKFICNSVVILDQIFMPAQSSEAKMLASLGYQIQVLDFSEFQLGGGAARCLVLNL
jgi:N-dimethylarginine dimethylaminohydrolase